MARRRKSNRRRRGHFGVLYKLLSVLVICGAIIAALTLFFRVDTVVVTGQQRYTEQQVREAAGVETGDNLYLLNKNTVANNIVTALPYIEHIRINRKLPDTLLIEVKECGTALAVIQDGYAWYISPGGKIVEQREAGAATDCGIISGCTLLAPSVGTRIANATEYASAGQRQNSGQYDGHLRHAPGGRPHLLHSGRTLTWREKQPYLCFLRNFRRNHSGALDREKKVSYNNTNL